MRNEECGLIKKAPLCKGSFWCRGVSLAGLCFSQSQDASFVLAKVKVDEVVVDRDALARQYVGCRKIGVGQADAAIAVLRGAYSDEFAARPGDISRAAKEVYAREKCEMREQLLRQGCGEGKDGI